MYFEYTQTPVDTQEQLTEEQLTEVQPTPSIADRGVQVSLNISSWGGQKLDKGMTKELNDTKRASSNASKVQKNLMAGDDSLRNIKKYESKIRAEHIRLTLPWGDRGPRLLPTSAMINYKEKIDGMLLILKDMWRVFLDVSYPNYRDNVAPSKMGDMYNYNDYPDPRELECQTFDYSLTFEPIAESGDWRVDVPKQMMEELQEQYENTVDSRVQTAISSSWDRVKTQIESMKDKLSIEMDDDGKNKDGKTVRYHDTFVQNATDLCDLLAHLNVTNDSQLDQVRLDLKNAIQGVSVETLKIPTNHATRDAVKTKLDDILSKYAL
jgi:hypothetical protein